MTLDRPLFPGYVFVHMPFADRARVLTLPNIVSLIGNRQAPATLSDEEISWIRLSMEHGNVSPYPYLTAGQRVVITGGILFGMHGIVVRTQSKSRVVVALDSIARAFVVEVDPALVQPVERQWPAREAV